MPKFWTGKEWRRVSEKEARFRRARGQEVQADEAVLDLPGVKSAEVAAELDAKEAAASTPFDLSDDELERLTKPES